MVLVKLGNIHKKIKGSLLAVSEDIGKRNTSFGQEITQQFSIVYIYFKHGEKSFSVRIPIPTITKDQKVMKVHLDVEIL